ncbi:hypothetical protein XU18_2996 [Perkinsela sp. CCAP 1560/4]|nr:hypothetical protein XU18_2996 [Perkinsela sp. CCAP 1560/4]|eukprot:KNH06059.1 hypothetical protein XU18_2996 [Perkinsela sp. CCAP 1560/4]
MQHAQIVFAHSYRHSSMARRIGIGMRQPAWMIGLPLTLPQSPLYLSQPRFAHSVSGKTHNTASPTESTEGLSGSRMRRALTWISPKLKEYGLGGVILYSLVHSLGFVLTLIILLCFWDEVLLVFRRFLPARYSESTAQCTSQLVIAALLINKLFGPLHMLCAVLLAPRYAPRMNQAMARMAAFFRA